MWLYNVQASAFSSGPPNTPCGPPGDHRPQFGNHCSILCYHPLYSFTTLYTVLPLYAVLPHPILCWHTPYCVITLYSVPPHPMLCYRTLCCVNTPYTVLPHSILCYHTLYCVATVLPQWAHMNTTPCLSLTRKLVAKLKRSEHI